jgi:flagellar motility protein MotE (MotC chaperone)
VREKLIYTLSFVLAFILVSGMMIYFNTVYKNIFTFDFTQVLATQVQIQEEKPVQEQAQTQPQQNLAVTDSVKRDSTKIAADSLLAVKDSVKIEPPKVNEASKVAEVQKSVVNDYSTLLPRENPIKLNSKVEQKAKKDSVYQNWVKQTCKLYETMDSKKAAKVITGYSDNIARDILLSMKKKKAAEILSEIRPEVVTRIISVN